MMQIITQIVLQRTIPGALMLLALLIALTVFDLQTRELPLWCIGISGAVGIIWNIAAKPFSVWNVLAGVAVGGVFLIISLISQEAIGRGDCYLICVIGLFLGIRFTLELLMLACLFASVVSLIAVVWKKKDRHYRIPFVPFLLAAHLCVLPGIL